MDEPEVSYETFKQASAWKRTVDGWRRDAMNGFAVEVVELTEKHYQPIANRHVMPRYDGWPPRLCKNLDEAIEYAWVCVGSLLETPRAL